MSGRMQSIIEDAQDYFGWQLKKQIQLLNDELNVWLNQKIDAQEKALNETEKKCKENREFIEENQRLISS